MVHSLARNSSLISLFFSHVTLNIERNNYEVTDHDTPDHADVIGLDKKYRDAIG